MNRTIAALFGLASCMTYGPLFAAEKVPVFNNVGQFTATQTQKNDTAPVELFTNVLSVSGEDSLPANTTVLVETGDTTLDDNNGVGRRAVTYFQSYQGLPVWNHELIILVGQNNQPIQGYGELVQGIDHDLPSIIKVSEHDQLQKLDEFLLEFYSDVERTFRHKAVDQVIYLDQQNTAHNALKFKFFTDVVYGQSQPEKIYAFVDVESGEVLRKFDALHRASVVGGAGPRGLIDAGHEDYNADDIGDDDTNPTTFMVSQQWASGKNSCYFDALNVDTRDAQSLTEPALSSFQYDCSNSTYNDYKLINSAKSPLNDAHYNAQVTSRMFEAYLGHKPFYDQKIVQNVHYGDRMDQAFYEEGQLYYGDGDYLFYPMVVLDVVAHEIAHGFTAEYGTGLEKLMISGQARAINEAFSDMSGEAAEFFLNGTNDWMSNEEAYQFDGALRYLDEPTKDGVSIDHVDDYNSQKGAHYAAGVFNKAFHRLATTANSPWNTKYAFIIFAKANDTCWVSNADYSQAADCVMRSAGYVSSLINDAGILKPDGDQWATSDLQNHVRKAFAQVGVSLKTNLDIESEYTVSPKFKTVSFSNTSRFNGLPLTGTHWQYVWDFGDGSETSSQKNPTHDFSAEGLFNVSLTVTDLDTGKSDVFTLPIDVNADYCAVSGMNNDKFFIGSVALNDVVFSVGETQPYVDHSAQTIVSTEGASIRYEIVAGVHEDSVDSMKTFQIWIDENDDGKFQSTEIVLNERALSSINGQLDFIGETSKDYRVRVLVSLGFRTDVPCGQISSSEIEDFSIKWENDQSDLVFNVEADASVSNKISFVNQTNDLRVASWQWDFDVDNSDLNGPAAVSYEKSPTHQYSKSGVYRVRLSAFDDDNLPILPVWTQLVEFTSVTNPLISVTEDEGSNQVIWFDAGISDFPYGSTFEWDFEDDGIQDSASQKTHHTYLYDGEYTVKLTILNDDNPTGLSTTQKIDIGSSQYDPAFSFSTAELGNKQFLVSFENTSIDPEDKATGMWQVSWDFGDGSAQETSSSWSLNESVAHTYSSDGNFQVTLTLGYNQSNGTGGWDWTSFSVSQSIELIAQAALEYCVPIDDSSYEYIANTTFNSQTFATAGEGGLVNAGQPIELSVDQENTYLIEAGYPEGGLYAEHYHVWIDLNRDGVFGDGEWSTVKTERVIKAWDVTDGINGAGFVSGSFTIPGDALPTGTTRTRMRILQLFNEDRDANQIDPCADYSKYSSSGEIEDYIVNIIKN